MFLRKFILAIIYIQKRFLKFNWNKVGIDSILPFERIKDWLFQLRGLSRVHNFEIWDGIFKKKIHKPLWKFAISIQLISANYYPTGIIG